jgi:hypothetical protein
MPVAQYIFLFIMLLVTSPVWATTWFVATSGNDTTGNGSVGAPWRTLQGCHDKSVVVAGDTCSVNAGTYTTASTSLLVNVTKSGLTFKSTIPFGAKLSGNNNVTAIGFNVGAVTVVIQDFEMFGFSSTAINANTSPGSSGLTVRGNLIYNIGRLCTDTDFGKTGMFTRNGTTNLLIERNIFHTIGRFDPGENGCSYVSGQLDYENKDHAIYIDGGSTIVVQNNIFYNNGNGWSVQLSPAAITGIKVINNTFADANPYRDGHILIATSITNGDFDNNIFYQPSGMGILCGGTCLGSGVTLTNVRIRNNLAFNVPVVNWVKAGATFSGNINNTNPLFTNAGARDYTLTAASPAKDAGLTTTATTDFTGASREVPFDIGAYEITDTTPPAAPTGLTVQ